MRWQALIILLAIGLSVIAPPSLPWLANSGGEDSIGTLDLCHSGSPALTGSGDMPCIQECLCQPLPPVTTSVFELPHIFFKPLLIAFQEEHPPQA